METGRIAHLVVQRPIHARKKLESDTALFWAPFNGALRPQGPVRTMRDGESRIPTFSVTQPLSSKILGNC